MSKFDRFREWIVGHSILLISIMLVLSILSITAKSAVQTIAGLAVAGPSSQWINLQDASVGTPIANGLAAVNIYGFNGTNYDSLKSTTANGLQVDVTRIQGGISPISGNKTPADAFANPTDAMDTWSFLAGFNGTTWDRLRSVANNADAVAVTTLGNITGANYLYGFNGTAWDRYRLLANNADAVAVTTLGNSPSLSYLYGFNGTTYDRTRSSGNNADAQATTTLGDIQVNTYLFGFNGTTWDRLRSSGNNADSIVPTTLGIPTTDNYLYMFDNLGGNVWNRIRGNTTAGLMVDARGKQMLKVVANPSTSGNTLLVSASGGLTIRVYALIANNNAGTANSIKLVAGTTTTTPCDTGPIDFTGLITLGTGNPTLVMGIGNLPYENIGGGNNLCISLSASTAVGVTLSYMQE